MKYIHLVMADFIKPLLLSNRLSKESLNKKSDTENKKEMDQIVNSSGMGDFDYKNCPVNINAEDEEYEQMSKKTENLISKIDSELAIYVKEQRSLEDRLNKFEKDLQKRKEVLELCNDLCQEGTREIERYSEKIEKFDKSINHHEEILDSWQCLIDELRKIPEETYCH